MGFRRRVKRLLERIAEKRFDKELDEAIANERFVESSEVEGLFPYMGTSFTDDLGMGEVEYYELPTGEFVKVKRYFPPDEDDPIH
jgi:hypothetical protein